MKLRRLRIFTLKIRRHSSRRHAHVPRTTAALTRADALAHASAPLRGGDHQLVSSTRLTHRVVHLGRVPERTRVHLFDRLFAFTLTERALPVQRTRRRAMVMNGQPERFLRADAVARAFRARDVRVSTRARRRAMESGREKSFGRDEHRARVRVTSRARESSENQSINHRKQKEDFRLCLYS